MRKTKASRRNTVDLSRLATSNAPVADIPVLRPKPKEKRIMARKGVWCVCTVSTAENAVREAVILDVSKTGARIRFRSRGTLPPKVWIKAGRIGLNRPAYVIWQGPFDAGLKFEKRPKP